MICAATPPEAGALAIMVPTPNACCAIEYGVNRFRENNCVTLVTTKQRSAYTSSHRFMLTASNAANIKGTYTLHGFPTMVQLSADGLGKEEEWRWSIQETVE